MPKSREGGGRGRYCDYRGPPKFRPKVPRHFKPQYDATYVIDTYSRPDGPVRTLESIAGNVYNQKYGKKNKINIVVLGDEQRDKPYRKVAKIFRKYNIELTAYGEELAEKFVDSIAESGLPGASYVRDAVRDDLWHRGAAPRRNLAALLAVHRNEQLGKARHLIFLDSDICLYPDIDYVDALVSPLGRPKGKGGVVSVSGRYDGTPQFNLPELDYIENEFNVIYNNTRSFNNYITTMEFLMLPQEEKSGYKAELIKFADVMDIFHGKGWGPTAARKSLISRQDWTQRQKPAKHFNSLVKGPPVGGIMSLHKNYIYFSAASNSDVALDHYALFKAAGAIPEEAVTVTTPDVRVLHLHPECRETFQDSVKKYPANFGLTAPQILAESCINETKITLESVLDSLEFLKRIYERQCSKLLALARSGAFELDGLRPEDLPPFEEIYELLKADLTHSWRAWEHREEILNAVRAMSLPAI